MSEPTPSSPMIWIGALVIAALIVYAGFQVVNDAGVSTESGMAVVVDHQFQPAGTTYVTQVINGVTRSIPKSTPPMWLLTLEIDGERVQHAVDEQLYDSAKVGDDLQVEFVRLRLTGDVEVQRVVR